MFFKRRKEVEEIRDYYSLCLEDFINKTHSSMKSLIKENKDLKEQIDKANNELIILIQIIMQQPSKNVEEDNYLLSRLESISNILVGGNNEWRRSK